MPESDPIVIVIDDDAAFRRSTERLVRSAGHKVQSFASGAEFLKAGRPNAPACVVLDVRMPGMSGLDLQKQLTKAAIQIPLIFITGHGDVPMSVQAMKAGALEFLTKPFREQDLLDAIQQSLKRDRAACEFEAKLAVLRAHYKLLTPREREVMRLIVAGNLNKQAAAELHATEKTIKFHRAHIMHKMQAQSFADLVRMAGRLGEPGPRA